MGDGFSKNDTKIIKGFAIIMMLWHHLFLSSNNYELLGLNIKPFTSLQIVFELADFGKLCVSIFVFLSGYGLYKSCKDSRSVLHRIFNTYKMFWKVFLVFVPIGIIMGKAEFNLVMIIKGLLFFSFEYNPTWWFMRMYIELLVFFLIIQKIFNYTKQNWYIDLGILFINYIVCDVLMSFSHPIVRFFSDFISYSFTFTFSIVLAKYDVLTKIKKKYYRNVPFLFATSLALVISYVLRTFKELYGLDFIYIIVICIFFAIVSTFEIKVINKPLLFLGKHSSNVFLLHTFWYYIWIPHFIYSPQYPILIFALLMGLSIASSFALNKFWQGIIFLYRKLKIV